MHTNPSIVVGVEDDVDLPSTALAFAGEEAFLRRAGVVVVHGHARPGHRRGTERLTLDDRAQRGERVVQRAAASLRELTRGAVPVSTANLPEPGIDALMSESSGALMVVVERHPRPAVARLAGGSTASIVAARAECPVVVVREGIASGTTVVVGVDPRGHSSAAVQVAAADAACRGVPLTAVQMWQTPVDGFSDAGYVPPDPAEKEFARQAAARSLAEAVAGLGEDFPGLEIRQRLIHGPALAGLLEVSQEACLLVVARHAAPGIASLGLGHLARRLLTDASCAVMVTPSGQEGRWQRLLHTSVPTGHNY